MVIVEGAAERLVCSHEKGLPFPRPCLPWLGGENATVVENACVHQHVYSKPEKSARFITATNRIIKAMDLDWQEQVEGFRRKHICN